MRLYFPGASWQFSFVPTPDWSRLGELVRSRRVQLGFRSRDRFAELAGVGSRTLGDLERGQPVSDNTLWALEPALRWGNGSWKAVLGGGEPSPITYLGTDPAGAASEASVTEKNPRPEDEIDGSSVGDDAEDARYVAHRAADDPAEGMDDAAVLALIRESRKLADYNRQLSDELERRIVRARPVEGAP